MRETRGVRAATHHGDIDASSMSPSCFDVLRALDTPTRGMPSSPLVR